MTNKKMTMDAAELAAATGAWAYSGRDARGVEHYRQGPDGYGYSAACPYGAGCRDGAAGWFNPGSPLFPFGGWRIG